MIAKRTLIKWRREALNHQRMTRVMFTSNESSKYIQRVLELTQVLIDQHLLEEDTRIKEANLPY